MTTSVSEATRRLEAAARSALHAPSVLNSQPWSWRIEGDTMVLSADRRRQHHSIDPDGRLLLISCGVALHHARTALAATGWEAEVICLPDGARSDRLARIGLGAAVPVDPVAQRMAAAIKRRRTDRRSFGGRGVSSEALNRMRRLVEQERAHLHVVGRDQVPMLAVIQEETVDAEYQDAACLADLDRWTSRPAWYGGGVPPATAVRTVLRRVPVPNFAPRGDAGLAAEPGGDGGTSYVILSGSTDRHRDLLRGGQALSALLLRATVEGLGTEVLSGAVEISGPRMLLHDLLPGTDEPYVVVRLGYQMSDRPLPAPPRRFPAEVIKIAR